MDAILQTLARELERSPEHVQNVVTLIDEGATIPFIARYRKELHGSMDDQLLRQLADRLQYLRNLEARKEEVAAAIENQGKLTEELSAAIDAAATLAEVEDLYRPYKQKRRTRATIAREKGLEPLVRLLFAQGPAPWTPVQAALDFLDPDKGVETAEDALQGASDILAEEISDDADIRKELRQLYLRRGHAWSPGPRQGAGGQRSTACTTTSRCPVSRAQGHQVLAVNRGEREGVLKVSVELDPETAHVAVRRAVPCPARPAMDFVRAAADDAYDRLIQPSMEREIRAAPHRAGRRGGHPHLRPEPEAPADAAPGEGAGSPWGWTRATAWAARWRWWTAPARCWTRRWSTPPTASGRSRRPSPSCPSWSEQHGVEHIAIGNGTASRETEQMAVELIRQTGRAA